MQMRPFKAIVESKHDREPAGEPSDRLVTPANVITASRLPLAFQAARMLINGEAPVSPLVAGIIAMDAVDGTTARLFDKFLPDLHIGRSKIGEPEDQWVDIAVAAVLSVGILKSPRVPLLAKGAVAAVIAQEGWKTAWAANKGLQQFVKTGEVPVVKTVDIGREAMIAKGLSVVTAVASGDINHPVGRQAMATVSASFAALGVPQGEQARQEYGLILAQQQEARSRIGMDIDIMIDDRDLMPFGNNS